jgi:hypothetical protein
MIVKDESPLTRLVAKVLSLLRFHFARHHFTLFYSTFVSKREADTTFRSKCRVPQIVKFLSSAISFRTKSASIGPR